MAAHPPVKGALELGAEGKLLEVGSLFFIEVHALVGEARVFEALEAVDDGPDLGSHAVGAEGSGGVGGCHAVGAVALLL